MVRTSPSAAPEHKLRSIMNISLRMNSERDPAKLLDLIAREAARLLDADRSSIFLLDRDKRELWSWVAMGEEEIRFDARLGIAGAVAMSGETLNVEDVRQDSRFYPSVDEETGYQTRSVLAVPLMNYQGEIIGAFEALNKSDGVFSAEDEEILHALAANAAIAIETAQLVSELREQRDDLLEHNTQLLREVEGHFATTNILGTSRQIQKVIRLIEQVADSNVSVLITGESGTGKELVARAIHHGSSRSHKKMITLNCAALPDDLLESELFGIEKGVATGVDKRVGKFEQADGSTLFLDEIGDLSLAAQAKILRALQERVIERVGGRKSIPVDVRILAATNKDLAGEIRKGNFRDDLFYRLKVVHIETPPLRAVPGDIPLIVQHCLTRCSEEQGRKGLVLSEEALQCLASYEWPGNVRELENEIRRLVASARRSRIEPRDLSPAIQQDTPRVRPEGQSLKEIVAERVEKLEMRLIQEALEECDNNQLRAARHLGLSRQGLIKKMKRYGLK